MDKKCYRIFKLLRDKPFLTVLDTAIVPVEYASNVMAYKTISFTKNVYLYGIYKNLYQDGKSYILDFISLTYGQFNVGINSLKEFAGIPSYYD